MIKELNSKNLKVSKINTNDGIFKALDVATSVNMGLPDKFTIPEKPEFALLTFNTLKDENGNPRKGLGVNVTLPDGSEKVITISTLSRKFFNESVSVGETSGKSQRALIDIFQDENIMQLSPSQQVGKLAGKTVEFSETSKVWLPEFEKRTVENQTPSIIGYNETEKKFYTVVMEQKPETEKKTRQPKN